MKWQKRARVVLLVVAVALVGVVAATMKRRTPQAVAENPVERTDTRAAAESVDGQTIRINRNEEKIRISFTKALTYPDGSSKMFGIKVTTDQNDRTFEITGDEGQVGEKESTIEINGNVRIKASDGMVVASDRMSFAEGSGVASAPGPVTFERGRTKGTGVGFTYDKNQDILTILDQALVHVDADEKGAGAMDVSAGAIEFRRREKLLRFDRMMKATRPREVVEADTAVAHLSADEQQLESMELRGNSRITASNTTPGGLQALTGRDVDLRYGAGEVIEHALVNAEAVIQLAGTPNQPGRQIAANVIDVSMAPDGTTVTGLSARDFVKLTLPAEPDGVGRTIESDTLESKGDARKGLSSAHFAGNVRFDERGPKVGRAARSGLLDVSVGPGFSSIDDARFSRAVRFADGPLFATAATARYVLDAGTLALSGSEPGSLRPHLVNDQLTIDADKVDVRLDGPVVRADGKVKSVVLPKKKESGASETRMPSMLKGDQPVNITADALVYQGTTEQASYTGSAQLWQGETLIKGSSLLLDSKKGDLSADGPVMTVSLLEQADKDGKKEKIRSTGAAAAFKYEEADRKASYLGEAHLNGPQGDITSPKIELFLQESGDALDRVEAYDGVTLRGNDRKTTGVRLTFFGEDNRYLVVGAPVTIVDSCGGETTGRTLTFYRTTDRIVVDGRDTHGNEQVRTQSTGKSNCPGS